MSGATVVVGAHFKSKFYVYTKPAGDWVPTTTAVTGAEDSTAFNNGVAVAGSTAVVGAAGATVGGHSGQGRWMLDTSGTTTTATTTTATTTSSASTASTSTPTPPAPNPGATLIYTSTPTYVP